MKNYSMYQPYWKDIQWDNKRWPNFHPIELAEKSDGWQQGSTPILIMPSFLDRLQKLREVFGKPLVIASGYRSPHYNNAVSKTGYTGPHTTGRAVDLKIHGKDAYAVLSVALSLGFTGIGIKQTGPYAGRFIHLDDLQEDETKSSRPWVWGY